MTNIITIDLPIISKIHHCFFSRAESTYFLFLNGGLPGLALNHLVTIDSCHSLPQKVFLLCGLILYTFWDVKTC